MPISIWINIATGTNTTRYLALSQGTLGNRSLRTKQKHSLYCASLACSCTVQSGNVYATQSARVHCQCDGAMHDGTGWLIAIDSITKRCQSHAYHGVFFAVDSTFSRHLHLTLPIFFSQRDWNTICRWQLNQFHALFTKLAGFFLPHTIRFRWIFIIFFFLFPEHPVSTMEHRSCFILFAISIFCLHTTYTQFADKQTY